MSTALAQLSGFLKAALGDQAVVTDPAVLRTYECDGLTAYRAVPGVVLLPANAGEVQQCVRACRRYDVPFVARGSGTGLSGGAMPSTEGALIVTAKLNRILDIDAGNRRAIVEPGVFNAAISQAVAPQGLYYAPDPSSQQICSIGGNVAENSGGAHCLKYGFTVHHVTGLEICTPDGDLVTVGAGKAAEAPGYDLTGVFIGSEGTLGIATKIYVRLLRKPESVVTVLAAFDDLASAGASVAAIVAAGLTPAAAEIMDALAISAAEKAVDCRYPAGAGAVLVVEVDGPAAEVAAEHAAIEQICHDNGAFEIRRAADAAERAALWRGRKSAFAAVGRISPDYIVQDGVVPRTALAQVLAEIEELASRHGIRVANVFHAGDGNLHPLVLYNADEPGALESAEQVSGAILDLCIAHGGSITGEHGVGVEKAPHMAHMFGADDLQTMQLVRCAFDPGGRANPGKVFPTPRLCGEPRGRRQAIDAPVDPDRDPVVW
ncbi:MAG TPA: FAD-linked oxidase C-terminal domain-containing protein [Micromonosporaceae bacterium]|nr:FAD-linked oxidase C-terminal domain-containing protein [Micromonosporaceae bacterium]